MSSKVRNIVVGGTEYEVGRLHVGSQAERLAYSPSEGDEWNQTGGSGGVVHYVYTKGAWVAQVVLGTEHVEVSFSVSGGNQSIVGSSVSLTVLGYSSKKLIIDSNNRIEFDVPIGATYILEYPVFPLYAKIADTRLVASQSSRSISQVYTYIGDSVLSVLLEQSDPNSWEISGNSAIADNLLSTSYDTSTSYGTFVIDEVHKIYAKLSPTNHTKFVDDTAWDGTYGNSFRRLPRVYYRVLAADSPILVVSDIEIAGGKYIEEDWIGTYKGSVVGGKLVSQPYRTSTQNTTMSAFWDYAKANINSNDSEGSDYGLVNYFDQQKLIMLHLAKFGCSDSTKTMGKGLQDAGSGYYTHSTGTTIALGDSTGEALYAGTYYMNKLFGIEDLAGATWEFRPNIRFTNNGATAIVYEGNIVSNSASGRSFQKLASASGAYVKNMVLGEFFDILPLVASGATSGTYWCDGAWAATGGELLLVGGVSHHGSLAGLSAASSYDAFSFSLASFGARLAFKGDISKYTYVTGAEMRLANGIS